MFVTLPPHFLSFSAHKACLGLTAKVYFVFGPFGSLPRG